MNGAPVPGKPVLHHLNHSQSQRILWLLEELDIDYDVVLHFRNPKTYLAPPELLKVHPTGKSPLLVLPNGHVIGESIAIATYLLRTYDKEHRFSGGPDLNEETTWLRDEELTSYASTSLGMVVGMQFLMQVLSALSPFFIRPMVWLVGLMITQGFTKPRIKGSLRYLETQLGERNYLMGEEPGKADFIISFPMDMLAERKFVDMDEFPKVKAWRERCQARPAWKSALNKGNGYDWTIF